MSTVPAVSDRLPVFPWDRLEPYKATAAAHPDGLVDLSVGTPVDPVPALVRQALTAAIFRESTTIGVRYRETSRECLEREVRTALVMSEGSYSIFFDSVPSLFFLGLAVLVIGTQALGTFRTRKAQQQEA